jgi:hypothetical protein
MQILVGNPERNSLFGRTGRRYEDNNLTDLQEIGFKDVESVKFVTMID